MKGYIGITSYDWWDNLKEQNYNQINFWNTMNNFLVLEKGDLFFFLKKNNKEESGERAVVGCAIFERFEKNSIDEAWEKYTQGNGCNSLIEFEESLRTIFDKNAHNEIGCIILKSYVKFETPVYLSKVSIEFQNAIVSGKSININYIKRILKNGRINYWSFGEFYLDKICHLASSAKIVNEFTNKSIDYLKENVIDKDLFSIDDSKEYEDVLDKIRKSRKYVEFKTERKSVSPKSGLILDHALNKYLDFLKYMENSIEEMSDTKKGKYVINLGVGRVQNITANNVFNKEKSLCEFLISAQGQSYTNMPDFCDLYFNKKHDRKYFGQIITPINLLGLIQTDENDFLIENTLLKYIYEQRNERLASYYMNYFLCMWQYPIPSTKATSGRDMKIFKPYCLLLKILLELHSINPSEAYLSQFDFSYLFLEIEKDMPQIDEINCVYAQNLIDSRLSRKAKGLSQENGSLTYIINTLAESDLLTKENILYPDAEDFYVGLKYSIVNCEIAKFIIRRYKEVYYKFNASDSTGNREVMSEYGEFLNDISKFKQWRNHYMNVSRISEFKTYCISKGFSYSDDLIRRFVLSLETKPFLLLTGISGSGKTKIAELWTMYLSDKGEAEGFTIAVGSNWTDNKKLVGFNNVLLSEEDAFQSTKLVELMREANELENNNKEYIIILDEMNLSRVEMYFADFLSALESLSHEITLANGDKIIWSKNIKIIGTVNVDESTYMFSSKVLDRANVIEML